MVGTATPYHYSIFGHIDHAKAKHSTMLPGALKEDALRVIVSRDGRVFLGNSFVERRDLTEMIREGIRNGAEKKVYVAADSRARYVDVAEV
jgi:biopolymer transport protein ExbD